MASAARRQIIGGGVASINKSRRRRRPQIVILCNYFYDNLLLGQNKNNFQFPLTGELYFCTCNSFKTKRKSLKNSLSNILS